MKEILFTTSIQLNSSECSRCKNIDGLIKYKLKKEHEKLCNKHGYVLENTLKVVNRSIGKVVTHDNVSMIEYNITMKLNVIYIFSHDSIGLGEDGPTHQPVEQLSGLRAIPNLYVFRPADVNETLECWEIALKSKKTPSAIALSRQKLPYINPSLSSKNRCELGAYEVKITSHENKVTLVASGSEVELALETQKQLKENNIDSSVVSMPCQELFDKQPEEYKKKILGEDTVIVTLEAGSTMSWKKYIKKKGISLGIDKFGESAPYKEVYNHFDLTSDRIVTLIQEMLRK